MTRHPIRGLLGGLVFGVGLSLVLVQLSIAPLGAPTVIVVIVVAALVGLGSAWVLPARPRS